MLPTPPALAPAAGAVIVAPGEQRDRGKDRAIAHHHKAQDKAPAGPALRDTIPPKEDASDQQTGTRQRPLQPLPIRQYPPTSTLPTWMPTWMLTWMLT